MRDFIRKPKNWFLVMIVLSVLAALIISFYSSFSTNLPSYNGANEIVEPAVSEEQPEQLETIVYTSETLGYSMSVPAEWTFAVKDGHDSYINPQDGAIISFCEFAYDPSINTVTEESVNAEISAANGLLGTFSWVSDTGYAVVYEVGALDYFEYNTWDLDSMIRVLIQVPAEKYNDYKDEILALLDTFAWTPGSPVPDGYAMIYSDFGHFEFPVPKDWHYGIEDGVFAAYSDDGMNFRVSLTSTTAGIDVQEYDYAVAMGQGKESYQLSSFSSSETLLTAEASFASGGVYYVESHNILATGEAQYEFLFQCPQSAINEGRQIHDIISRYFRIF